MSFPPLLVLAGGMGTRLREVVNDRPKILAPIGHRPYIAHFLDWCVAHHLQRIHFCLGYKADQVIQWLSQSHYPLTISWHVESEQKGTAAAIQQGLYEINSECDTGALICNGDTFIDFDVQQFVMQSQIVGGGILTTQVEDCGRYGSVKKDKNSLLLSFYEKSTNFDVGEINAGWYYLGKLHIEQLQQQKISSFEKEYLAVVGMPSIKCINIGTNFLDFGTPASYQQAQNYFGYNNDNNKNSL